MVRRCEGPEPESGPPVAHPALPAAVLMRVCPMRSVSVPGVVDWIVQYARAAQWSTLPRRGGLDDQDARLMEAFDVIATSLRERAPSTKRSR